MCGSKSFPPSPPTMNRARGVTKLFYSRLFTECNRRINQLSAAHVYFLKTQACATLVPFVQALSFAVHWNMNTPLRKRVLLIAPMRKAVRKPTHPPLPQQGHALLACARHNAKFRFSWSILLLQSGPELSRMQFDLVLFTVYSIKHEFSSLCCCPRKEKQAGESFCKTPDPWETN